MTRQKDISPEDKSYSRSLDVIYSTGQTKAINITYSTKLVQSLVRKPGHSVEDKILEKSNASIANKITPYGCSLMARPHCSLGINLLQTAKSYTS